jgi:transposase
MRGDDAVKGSFFSYIDLEKRVRLDHPLRLIREIANAALSSLTRDFAALYSPIGRESIPPERLLRGLLLQAFYSIRSERQLVERIDTDLLFRWFVGLGIEDPVWNATTFTKNRDRLLDGAIAQKFLAAVLADDKVTGLLSDEHFSVEPAPAKAGGTLLEAWFQEHAPSSRLDLVLESKPRFKPRRLTTAHRGPRRLGTAQLPAMPLSVHAQRHRGAGAEPAGPLHRDVSLDHRPRTVPEDCEIPCFAATHRVLPQQTEKGRAWRIAPDLGLCVFHRTAARLSGFARASRRSLRGPWRRGADDRR